MTFIIQNRGIWALLLAFSVSACSGAGDFAGRGKSSDKKGSDEKEEDDADEPAEVAGAFLMDCRFIATDTLFGCTAKDKTTEKAFAKDEYDVTMGLENDAGDEVSMKTEAAPEESDFHMIGSLPAAYKDSGRVTMTVKSKVSSGVPLSASIKTTAIAKQGAELGGIDPSTLGFDEFGTGEAPKEKTKLQRFEFGGIWLDANGVAFGVAIPSNFCNNGNVLPELASSGQMISNFSTGLINGLFQDNDPSNDLKVDPRIQLVKKTIELDTKMCFGMFAAEIGGKKDWAWGGAGCLLVRGTVLAGGKSVEGIMVGPETQNGQPISEEDLRAFVKAKNAAQGCN